MKNTVLRLALCGLLSVAGFAGGCADEADSDVNGSDLALRGGNKASDGGAGRGKGKGDDKIKSDKHDGGAEASDDDDADEDAAADESADDDEGDAGHGHGGKPSKGGSSNGKGHDAGH